MNRPYPVYTVSEKAEKSLRGGHVWVYADEVTGITGNCENGELVDVVSGRGKYLGTGFLSQHSKIRVRVISKNTNDRFDDAFWERRLHYAVAYRKTVMGKDFSACRLIFGEADSFPGLTVDRFGSVLVAQVLSVGIERIKGKLFSMLLSILAGMGEEITVLYERSDSSIRALEGLLPYTGFAYDKREDQSAERTVLVTENGLRFRVDYGDGQKTGFFLDQKYNRQAVARLAGGKTVLDCFTHTGAFALNAAAAGAKSVTAVDISADALTVARANAELNGLADKVDFTEADVFAYLTALERDKHSPYDFIILDPPAFTKSTATVSAAYRGYRDINARAMKLLPRGGYLATCSCSHFMTDSYFCRMLHDAAEDAKVSLRQIEGRQQSPDHPILWNVPETEYLKFYLFQVI